MSNLAQRVRRFLTWLFQVLYSLRLPLRRLLEFGFPRHTRPIVPRQIASRMECNPTPLPKERPRRLTLSDSARGSHVIAAEKLVKTCDQSQSRLFSKLPLELRQSIYRYVLGGKVIHVTRLQTRLGHVTCFHVAREDVKKPYSPSSHQCWGIRYARTTLFNGLRDEERTDDKDAVSALVKTCRRVYSESIGFLYQENVFNVNTPETILLLKETVLPHRLQVISSVEMTWIVSYEDAVDTSEKWLMRKGAWEQAWKVLGDMKGLQSLWVQLQQDAGWEMSIEDEERVVLQKAKNVRLSGHKKWTLVLHWDTMNDVSDAEQLPFRIENRQTIWLL